MRSRGDRIDSARRMLERTLETMEDESYYEPYDRSLRAMLFAIPLNPCSCPRCHALISVDRIDHHWAVHEMTSDSIGAPGSTRWCPKNVTVIYHFGMTGVKANARSRG